MSFFRLDRGFTMIEMVLYIALVSIIVVFSSLFIHALLQSKTKSRAIVEVEEQGVQMLNIVTQSIRNSQAINSPSAGEGSSVLSVEVDEPEKNPTVFEFSQNALWMKEGDGENIPLSGQQVLVTEASFWNLSRENTPGIIRIQFILSSASGDANQEYKYSQTFYASAALR